MVKHNILHGHFVRAQQSADRLLQVAALRSYGDRSVPASSEPYSGKHSIVQDDLVPYGGKRVQARQCEQRIRQIPVNILRGLEYRRVFCDPEIEIKKAKMKNAAMVDEGHEAHDWDDEQQRIERQVRQS